MKSVVKSVLGLGIVALAVVAFYNVSWAEKPGDACPAMGCPAMQRIHGEDPGASGVSPGGSVDSDGRTNPHDQATPGICPYSGAISEMNQA